ncbi:MAG: hypothetical protein KME14_02680 [Tildeniella torsiva UHER 1998/13D]|nr:hypothetical protein [Tildeniella torsiva UHER 1998/13D]
MLNVTKHDINPIIQISKRLDPSADLAQMSGWGILFLVCGALAGQSEKRILKNEARVIKPETIDEANTIKFSKYIKTWSQNTAAQMLAKKRINDFGVKIANRQIRDNLISYFSMAIMLDSLGSSSMEEFVELRNWVEDNDLGWAGMFFGAGLLLSEDSEVRWDDWSSSIISISNSTKSQVKELFDSYSSLQNLQNAIRILHKSQKAFRFSANTLLADIALFGLAFDVLDSAYAVEILSETRLPHRGYPIARTAFEAAQQAMVLATQENYALAGARAWIYFCKKDSEWLAQSCPEGSGINNREDAEIWFKEKLAEMLVTWGEFSPGKQILISNAVDLLNKQSRRPDNWLGQSMGSLQDEAYKKIAKFFGNDIVEGSVEMNRSIYSRLSKETHARARLEPVSFGLGADGFINVEFATRDTEVNSKSVSLSTALSVQEAAMSLVYRMNSKTDNHDEID